MVDRDKLSLLAFFSLLISIVAVYLDAEAAYVGLGALAVEFAIRSVVHFVLLIAFFITIKYLYYFSRKLF